MKRFGHVFIGSQLENFVAISFRSPGRDDDDIRGTTLSLLAELFEDRKPIESRQHQIQQHEMDLLVGQNFQGGFPVIGSTYMVAVTHQVKAQHLTQRTVILHDEDCQFFRRWLFLARVPAARAAGDYWSECGTLARQTGTKS